MPPAAARPAFRAALALAGVLAVVSPLLAPPVQAETAPETYRFDQPPEPLLRALTRIGAVVGTSVLIEGDGMGLQSPALSGRMTLDAALAKILAPSGGAARLNAERRIIVTLPPRDLIADPVPSEVLGTVVITATGTTQHLADAPATMTVIPGDDLRQRPAATPADLLRGLPGLALSAPGREGAPAITLRGMGQPYVLFMVDGRPLSASEEASYNGHGSNSKIGFLPPTLAIGRIEVIRGPLSALYGSAASGGVVNIITRDIPEHWGGTLALGRVQDIVTGSGTGRETQLMLGGPLIADRLGLLAYASHNNSHKTGTNPGQSERVNLGVKLQFSPDTRQSVDLDLQQSRMRYHPEQSMQMTTVRDRSISLSHRISWPDGAESTSFLHGERTDFRSGNISGHDALTLNTRTAFLLGRHDLTLGYEFRHERTRHDPTRLPGSPDTSPDRWHHAVFAEGGFRLVEGLHLTLGLRGDRNQNYGNALTPRAYLVWHVTPDLTLKGGIGSGFRVPALKQGDSSMTEPSGGDGLSRDRGNSALRPERSTNVELGLVWERETGLQLGATLFHTRFHDRITRVDLCRTATGQPAACPLNGAHYIAVTQYVNEDRAKISGLELTMDLPLGDADLSANYTYSASEVTRGRNQGQPFHTLPRHMLNLALDWRASERLTLWAEGRWRSHSLSVGRTAAVPAHVIADLGLRYDLGAEATLALGLYNLTDRRLGDAQPEGRRLSLSLSRNF